MPPDPPRSSCLRHSNAKPPTFRSWPFTSKLNENPGTVQENLNTNVLLSLMSTGSKCSHCCFLSVLKTGIRSQLTTRARRKTRFHSAGFSLARAFFWFDYPRANRLFVVYVLETVAFHYRRNGVKMPYNGYNQFPIALHSSRTSGYVPCSQDQQIS